VGFDLSLALLTRENARATGHDYILQIVKKQAHSNNQNLSTMRAKAETMRDESRVLIVKVRQAKPPLRYRLTSTDGASMLRCEPIN